MNELLSTPKDLSAKVCKNIKNSAMSGQQYVKKSVHNVITQKA